MKKVCTTCHEEKNLADFRKDKTRKDGHQSYCTICARTRHQSDYVIKYKDKIAVRGKARHAHNAALLLEYKQAHPCVNCGEDDPVCLDFHHLDPSEKDFGIGQEIRRNWDNILTEINKCVVLCSNCHRKVHAGKIILAV